MVCQTLVETLEAVDGLELYCEVHQCPGAKGVIIALHDYGEHSGIYRSHYARLCQEGYTVYAKDLRGHGKSPGDRGLIVRFEDYLEDLDLLMARVKDREDAAPVFLLGQGLGALIAVSFAFSRKPRMKGLILCGLVMDLPVSAWDRLLMRYAGPIVGRAEAAMPVREALLGPVLDGPLKQDELAFRGTLRVQTVREILGACQSIRQNHPQIPFAILSIQGQDSKAGRASELENWLDAIMAVNKSVLRYEGSDHHLLLHKEKDQVIGDIIDWCELHRLDENDDDQTWDELENDAL